MLKTLISLAALTAIFGASTATAQDADAALADLTSLVAVGSFEPEELPAVSIAAEDCVLTYTLRNVSPQLGVPLTAEFEFDAREVEPAAFAPEPSPERMTMWIPRSDRNPVNVTMTLDTDDAGARAAFEGGLGADCSAAGPCSGMQAAPRLPFAFFLAEVEDGMVRARDISTALSAFAASCGG